MSPMNYSIVRVVFSFIIGLVLVMWPDAASDYLVITIGILFIVPGLIGIIGYLTANKERAVRNFPIAFLGSLLFGIWLVVMPEFFSGVLMFALGFVLMLGGVEQLYSLFVARKWTTVPVGFYITPILILLCGLLILFDPLSARDTAFIIIGVASMVYSLSELITWIRFMNRKD